MLRRGLAIVSSASLLALAGASVTGVVPALAASCTVNSAGDQPKAVGLTCDSTAGAGVVTLRSAIERVSAVGGSSTINFSLANPSTITLGSEVHLLGSPAKTVTIAGPGASALTVDGNGSVTNQRVLEIDTGAAAVISGVTIANGKLAGGVIEDGGGILAGNSDLTISNSVFTGNRLNPTAIGEGGAIFAGTGNLTVSNTTFANNVGNGGSIEDGAAILSTGPTSLSGDVFSNNAAIGKAIADGGAIQAIGVPVTVRNSTFTANMANANVGGNGANSASGGAILAGGTGASLTLIDSTFTGNSTATGSGANSSNGGAVFSSSDTLTVTGSTFNQNSASVGPINNGNISAAVGGALDSIDKQATLINDTLTGNTATSPTTQGNQAAGGALSISGKTETAALTNLTITQNSVTGGPTSAGGGAIQVAGSPTVALRSSIMSGNTSTPAGTADCAGSPNSSSYNVETTNTCGLTGTGDLIGVDPQVNALASNGGPTPTQALQASSPAIDHVGSGCPPPATDQRGVARPNGPFCDSGAYELEHVTAPIPGLPLAGSGPDPSWRMGSWLLPSMALLPLFVLVARRFSRRLS